MKIPPADAFEAKTITNYLGLKISLAVVSVVLILACCTAAVGIIWYEKYGVNSKRIFVNKATSTISFLMLIGYLTAEPLDVVLIFVQGLPEQICITLLWWKMVLVNQIGLVLNAIVVVRYFLIFWSKNPANFKDDFWSFFVNAWTTVAW